MKRVLAVTWLTLNLMTSAAFAQEVRKIEVRATGGVTVAADELTLRVEIITAGDDFAALKQRNDLLLSQLYELLAMNKVQRPEIESTKGTFDFSQEQPRQGFQGSKGEFQQAIQKPFSPDPFGGPKQDAAQASADPSMYLSRMLTLRFASLSQATELLAKLTTWDAVKKSREIRLQQLIAGVKEGESHQSRARQAAVQNALKKAQLLAGASNLKLGPAVSIVDESAEGHSRSGGFVDPLNADPFGRHGSPALDSAFVVFQPAPGAAESSPGQIHFSVTLRVVYEATLPK